MPTYIYILTETNDHNPSNVICSAFSTLEAAMADANSDRNPALNPEAFVWENFGSDIPNTETWTTSYKLAHPHGSTGYYTITKTPLDQSNKM